MKNIYLENKAPQETQPIYRLWIRLPQTETTMQIFFFMKSINKTADIQLFRVSPPRQLLTLGSEEFRSLAGLKM